MFTHFKNIDTAFQHIRRFTYLLVFACVAICCFAIYESYRSTADFKAHIYILANGKALEAVASDRKSNIPVEARDHIKVFHEAFFNLDPDDKQIRAAVTKALYLADESAKKAFDDLQEKGYYNSLVSGNVSQQLTVDSISLNTVNYPYEFTCYATEKLVRSTTVTLRSLVTRGDLRNVNRSDNNPHGFLIEHWETLDNHDLSTQNRQP